MASDYMTSSKIAIVSNKIHTRNGQCTRQIDIVKPSTIANLRRFCYRCNYYLAIYKKKGKVEVLGILELNSIEFNFKSYG